MKPITIISALLILYGCSMSKELIKEQTETVYEHNVDLLKNDLRQKLILYANEKFVSSKAVIQTDDDGLLAGNGMTQLSTFITIIKMEFTFIIKYTDNNYKVKWIVKDLMTDSGSITPGNWGYYSDNIKESIEQNDKELFEYLSNKMNEF